MSHHLYFITLCYLFSYVSSSDIGDIGINTFAASRSLLEVKTSEDKTSSNGTVYNVKNCTIIYTRGLKVQYRTTEDKASKYVDLADLSSVTPKVSGTCDNSSSGAGKSEVKVVYEIKTGNVTSLTLDMVFNATRAGKWELQKTTVSMKCTGSDPNCKSFTDAPFKADFVASTRGFSYHCSQPPMIKSATNATNITLIFNKLQVQPFDVKKGRFSHADDCIGFFSIGVWSGLFVTLLLTLIFAYGVIMISNISVGDRFDDAKGPGIQVNVQE